MRSYCWQTETLRDPMFWESETIRTGPFYSILAERIQSSIETALETRQALVIFKAGRGDTTMLAREAFRPGFRIRSSHET